MEPLNGSLEDAVVVHWSSLLRESPL
jgi:hypothetical protein